MRDFNNGGDLNVGGDLHITDNSSNEHKLLIHCATEELLLERPFRQGNLRLEFKRKLNRTLPFIGLAVLTFLGTAIWAQINGKIDLVAFAVGVGSLLVGYASLQATLEPNAFELQERAAIEEINMILKSRRVE